MTQAEREIWVRDGTLEDMASDRFVLCEDENFFYVTTRDWLTLKPPARPQPYYELIPKTEEIREVFRAKAAYVGRSAFKIQNTPPAAFYAGLAELRMTT